MLSNLFDGFLFFKNRSECLHLLDIIESLLFRRFFANFIYLSNHFLKLFLLFLKYCFVFLFEIIQHLVNFFQCFFNLFVLFFSLS